MKYSIFTSIITTVCFGILITISSCSNPKNESTSGNSTAQVTSDTMLSSSNVLDRNLYNLYIEVDSIKNYIGTKNKRMVFNFYVNNYNSFTLHGWLPTGILDNGNDFDSTSYIKLKVGSLSKDSLKIDRGTYLGNVVVKHTTIKKIENYTGGLKYLVFFPQKNNYGRIKYNLNYTNDNPFSANSTFHDASFLGEANPTPPRQYNGD